MWRRPALFALALFLAEAVACRTRPLAYGEALLVIDTDAAIPKHVSRLRVDVLREDGSTLDSRDLVVPRPEDWPISFSVAADQEDMRSAVVRLRAYAEGHATTRAEALHDGGGLVPSVATTIEEACADAPTLILGTPLQLRRGMTPITTILPFATDAGASCTNDTRAGSAVAKVVITEKAHYQFSIAAATPNGARREPGGDTTLSIRKDCAFGTSQIACNDDIDVDAGNRLSRVSIDLDPGTYWLVTGGAEAAPADLTLLGLKDGMTVAAPVMDPIVDDAERLEPAAGATIDRLVQVELVQGYRGTMSVLLAGECFGTPADLVNRLTCVDRAGVRLPLPTTVVDGDLTPILPRPPLWSAEIDAPCTLPPRAGSGLREEDICVPGGVFLMGDTLALTDLDLRTRPEHMRVVAPFFLDRFEFTVGRYKAALAAGFVPKTGDPFANEAPVIKPDTSACTYSATGNGRDAFPLTCVSAYVARALCQFVGADLPTEDQWEYAATAAGRPIETQYAWGDDLPPGCEHAAVERADTNADRCKQLGYGPVAVDDPLYLAGDTTKLGLVGLGGNVQEWLQTGLYAYDHEVWRNAGLHDALPALANDTAPLRATRGGDWAGFGLFTTASARRALAPAGRFDNGGFRCARPGR